MRGEKGVEVGVGIGSVKNPPLVQPEQARFYIYLHIVCLYVVRTFKIYSLSNVRTYNTVL